jgi:hypothetical protein
MSLGSPAMARMTNAAFIELPVFLNKNGDSTVVEGPGDLDC